MWRYIVVLLFSLLVFADEKSVKHILVLNSYHQTFAWSKDVLKAINDVLQPSKNNYILHVENMDTKRVYDPQYLDLLAKVYKEKYKNIKFSLILANDNNAYDFLRKRRDKLFGDVPTVFCGVNFFKDKDIKGLKNFTGVAENLDPVGTIKAALNMFPSTKHIFVLNDYLKSGRAVTQETLLALKKLNLKNIDIHVIKNLTKQQLENKLSHLPKNSIVLLGAYFKDKNNVYYNFDESTKFISESSNSPVFCLVDLFLKHDIVGGSVVGGYYQGLAMAKIAKRVLNGEDINKIPVEKTGTNQYVFNYYGLKKFGISLKTLPKDAKIINKPISFFERYKLAIQIALVIITILLIIILILVLQNKRVREAKNELQKLKDNLEILVKERTKSLAQAKKEVEELHKKTKDSINYASLIQQAVLPQESTLNLYFKDSFVFYEPRDTVGGDIWFIEEIQYKNECLLFVIDCTGHGVPGAFVTMIVKAIEREIVTNLKKHLELEISPSLIMSQFNQSMKELLKQTTKDSKSNVGFDGGIIYYNRKEQILKFTGAETPLFYVEDGEVKMIKGDKYSVGYKNCDMNYKYKEHILKVKEGMKFYISTDGYLDQIGGEKGFPFSKKRFKKIIEKNYDKPMKVQKEIFIQELLAYQGKNERTDDITVIGFEIDS